MILKIRFTLLIIIISISLAAEAQISFKNQIGVVDSLNSEVLKETREFYIEVPDSYFPGSQQRYPVVYLLDGDSQFNALYTIHSYYSGGYMPEMILVGISNAKNRTRDLTTSKLEKNGSVNFSEEHGESDNFYRFIESELIPHVEKNYPATSYRTLIGHSYAGLFAIHTLLNHSESFANYIAIDPSLDWDNQALVKQSKQILSGPGFSNKALFMSLSGQLHMYNKEITIDNVMEDQSDMTLFARSNIEFSQIARKEIENGFRFNWKFYPNDIHGTIPLPSMMDALITVFEWYQMENIERFNDPEAGIEELKEIVSYRDNKLFEHFGYREAPYPSSIMNMKGYMSMDMEQYDLAKMYFDLNIKYYPNDANSYDSMADYHERQKEYGKALENVTKAYELSGNDYHKKRMQELQEKINPRQ